MKSYIFLTTEGYTFQPGSEVSEPDIENCQVIGFANGSDTKEAFLALINENSYLLKTNFNELICYELRNSNKEYFYMNDYSNN